MGPCCVEGCNVINKDTVYFEFPTSRGLRRKWLEMIKIPAKIPLGTRVCSQHFNCDDYEIVRGKVRLKRKVVPTLRLYNNFSKPLSPAKKKKTVSTEENSKKEETLPEKPVETLADKPDATLPEKPVETLADKPDATLPENKEEMSENPEETLPEKPEPDSTTDLEDEPKDISRRESKEEDKKEEAEDEKDKAEDKKEKEEDICKVINKDSKRTSEIRVESIPLPDLKQPPDFEDMITNYQIKNSKPNTLLAGDLAIEVPPIPSQDEPIVVGDKEDTAPVFIEISVDTDNNTAAANQDCLMVLESVQVDVDPTSLMLPEREYDEDTDDDVQVQEEKAPDKKDDPISLLTSSDEDDVIIEEPHIDTVEVSDETDEDDVPLVKFLKRKPSKKKRKSKGPKPDLQKLVWRGIYDFYCMQCHFSTSNNLEYKQHLQEHQKVLQVCHICNYTTSSKTQFIRHVRKHKEEKKYKCHLCEYKARHNISLIYHIQLHEKDSEQIKSVKKGFKCKKCSYRADLKSVVLKHVRMCGVQKFYCDQCMYVTKRKSDLKRHWLCRHQSKVVNVESDGSCPPDWD